MMRLGARLDDVFFTNKTSPSELGHTKRIVYFANYCGLTIINTQLICMLLQ